MVKVKEFTPLRPLRNAHMMTMAATFWRRKFPRLPASVPRHFEVEPGTKIRGDCHWQENLAQHPTLVLVHGLEGSSESGYILGTAEKAWRAGFNVIRLNQRNCGGTEDLTETLYHSGLSRDIHAVIVELIACDALPEIFAAGFSMGGNLVLKMAGELGDSAPPQVRGFAAVAPSMDLASCAAKLEKAANFLYQRHFVMRLKRRMRYKAKLFPGVYQIDGMRNIRSVRDFDDVITARYCGFQDAADYYAQSSASQFIAKIRRPTLIVAAQNDPVVPFAAFQNDAVHGNPNITLLAAKHGGHCAFIANQSGDERFWSEARIVDFCREQLQAMGD
jgi:predicted alpha/beta-fold hydrolase